MGNLIGILGRWFFRNLLNFVFIISILLVAGYLQKEIKAYLATRDKVTTLENGREDLTRYATNTKEKVDDRIKDYEKLADDAMRLRVSELDQEIEQKSVKWGSTPDPKICLLLGGDSCDQYFDGLKLGFEIDLLKQERSHLLNLRSMKSIKIGEEELERLRIKKKMVYSRYQNSELLITILEDLTPFGPMPFTQAYDQYQRLLHLRVQLSAQNAYADRAYMNQKRLLDAIKKGGGIVQKPITQIGALLQPLDQQINEFKNDHAKNWFTIFLDSVNEVVPTAIGILVGIVLAPIGIKGFFYFIIAPLTSRRNPIILVPEASGELDHAYEHISATSGKGKVSSVARSITINQSQELLIHPEYLFAFDTDVGKDYKWLLDWSYPLTSVAAGLFGLTRIRTNSTTKITVAATNNPLNKVGIISLPKGSVLVLQPHKLIGVVQPVDCPVRISKHWRLGSLHAWLTLQLRFLTFHGPVQLVVQGCRGVKVEAADAGRSINQAATIGFSANLAYSTTRCEAFGAYLMGKQELFNDHFGGGPGFYVYEQMPHGGRKTGLFGRGVEGFSDSLMKVLGI